ncbi:hypothetical protein [Streptomyces sp. I6]|uniref:hypothetical protein n=1 Tax=Streptomyces sp. I6 TaxID=2483113 RepID=UPI00160831E3|nr:hypothetical protein [Streptomyces sp. I6]
MRVLQLGMLVAAFDQTALGVALPNLVADLGSVHDLVWVVGVNLLAATVSAPLWGSSATCTAGGGPSRPTC